MQMRGSDMTSIDTRRAVARELAVAADVTCLTAALADFFMVKGPVLAATYEEPSERRYSDLDVVVRPDELPSAIEALEQQGARLLDANWEAAVRDGWGQVHLRMPHGTLVDLHWHLVNMGRVRATLAVNMLEAWRDLRIVDIPGGAVPTLSVANTVVHVALHAALGGAWQRRWFEDMRAVIAAHDVDWSAVVARAADWRVRRLVGVALARAKHFGRAEVPDDVLMALLRSAGSRRSIAWFDRVFTPLRATHDWSPARLWPHLLRDDWRAMTRAAGWRIERRLRNGPSGFWRGRTMPHEMIPSGGDAGRARYLRLVSTGALDRSTR